MRLTTVVIFHHPNGYKSYLVDYDYYRGIIKTLEREGIDYKVEVKDDKVDFYLGLTPDENAELALIIIYAEQEENRVLEERAAEEQEEKDPFDDDAYEYDQDPQEGLPEDDMFYNSGQGKPFDRE